MSSDHNILFTQLATTLMPESLRAIDHKGVCYVLAGRLYRTDEPGRPCKKPNLAEYQREHRQNIRKMRALSQNKAF